MAKKLLVIAALAVTVGAAFLVLRERLSSSSPSAGKGFVQTRGSRFVVDGRPFRFVGANVAVIYRDEDRKQMPETIRRAAQARIRVVRVWASGEGGPNDVRPVADFADWPRTHPFRWAPGQWNEEAFVHLDQVLAEAARNNLRVQVCLANWWRDTGGVTQYLRWAGIQDAADDKYRFGINSERAMLFYTNVETRRLYREHLERLATRRNTVTGVFYRDDPTIFGWELINEAQAVTSRWDERREWLADHHLPSIDYCDVHNYPRDDLDSFVDSPTALREFIDNRAASAFSIKKPLVFGEFGMGVDGYNGFSQAEWLRAFLEGNLQAGSAGAMFWILTPDANRGYGITYAITRDSSVLAEIARASQMFASLQSA